MSLRPLILFLFLSPLLIKAQTVLRITDVKVTENENMRTGPDVTAQLRGEEGKNDVVVFADQDLTIAGSFKVRSHNVRRSSVKDSAVYLTLVLKLKTGDKTDKREVQKVFYMDDRRSTTFNEKFVLKRGIDTRVITVSFNGEIQ